MAALTLRAGGSPLQPPDGSAFNLPMATLDGKPGGGPPTLLKNNGTNSFLDKTPPACFRGLPIKAVLWDFSVEIA